MGTALFGNYRSEIMKGIFSFLLGTAYGVYAAQNYSVPNVQKLFNTGVLIAKHIEQNYPKPPKKPDDDA